MLKSRRGRIQNDLIFFATETVMLDDFLGRRGFSTSYGKKMVNKNMYIHGMITHETNQD